MADESDFQTAGGCCDQIFLECILRGGWRSCAMIIFFKAALYGVQVFVRI